MVAMLGKISAVVAVGLGLLVPAVPAGAQAGAPRSAAAACAAVVVYADVRELVAVDLDTASDQEVKDLGDYVLSVARTNSLNTLAGALQRQSGGTTEQLRAFLRTSWKLAWTADLRIAIYRTLTNAGPRVQAAGSGALAAGTIDAYLGYLNHGVYVARAAEVGPVVVYADVRGLVTIDLDTASDQEVDDLADQMLSVAEANSLNTLAGALRRQSGGTTEQLRAFLRTSWKSAWTADLRIAIYRTLTNAGSHVQAAGSGALADGNLDAYLGYLNHGVFVARASDCAI